MTGAEVAELYTELEHAGVRIWIDGGWDVDALLGEVTRPHGDLDIAIEARDEAPLRAFLQARGYRDAPRPDASAWNFTMTEDSGREVDAHVIVFDAQGNGVLGPPENGNVYPAGALEGEGAIAGARVRCVAAPYVLLFRNAYEPGKKDRADVLALCARFSLPLPSRYVR